MVDTGKIVKVDITPFIKQKRDGLKVSSQALQNMLSAVLKEFFGKTKADPNFVEVITRDGKKLSLQAFGELVLNSNDESLVSAFKAAVKDTAFISETHKKVTVNNSRLKVDQKAELMKVTVDLKSAEAKPKGSNTGVYTGQLPQMPHAQGALEVGAAGRPQSKTEVQIMVKMEREQLKQLLRKITDPYGNHTYADILDGRIYPEEEES